MIDPFLLIDAVAKHQERVVIHQQRQKIIMTKMLDELDEFYNLLVEHWHSLIELGLLEDFNLNGKKLLAIVKDESYLVLDMNESAVEISGDIMEALGNERSTREA